MTEVRGGLFITFEGTEGSGKTTQLEHLVERLAREGYGVTRTVEPGGTGIGREIRRILLDSKNSGLDARAELLLYFASRAQNVAEVICPALEQSRVVVCDRFTDSTLVYQGAGRGLGREAVEALHDIACGALQPDLTIYLDIDLETGLERALARNRAAGGPDESRMDNQAIEFHRRVREAYLRLAERERRRFRVIDARGTEGDVARAVWSAVQPELETRHVR
jgi:dTMP kinase